MVRANAIDLTTPTRRLPYTTGIGSTFEVALISTPRAICSETGDALAVVDWIQKPVEQERLKRALHEALAGLKVDGARMLANIDSLQGLVFAEAATRVLGQVLGQSAAHHVMEQLSQRAVAEGAHLRALTLAHVSADAVLRAQVDHAALQAAFDPQVAAEPARALTLGLLDQA